MKKRAALVLAVIMTLSGLAYAKEPETNSWDTVERLRPGTMVVVEQSFTLGDYRHQKPCGIVHVDHDSLTCLLKDGRSGRIVYPASEVLTVYRVRMRTTAWSWVRTALLGGAGFLLGCAITDDEPDYPLGGLGAADGALYGLGHLSRHPQFEIVFWRTDESAREPAAPGQ